MRKDRGSSANIKQFNKLLLNYFTEDLTTLILLLVSPHLLAGETKWRIKSE